MEQIGYLIAMVVVLGFFAMIIWELFISGLKFILFIIGLAIVVAIYQFIQANMEIIQNILGYAKYLLVIFPFVLFAYLWKRTKEKKRIEELEEEDITFCPEGEK
ncbi:MAG: hypothetical protein ACFN08_03430 [Granulicatella sp.]